MLIVETVVRVRREHADGKSIKAIARDLRLSRKVVRKAIRAPEAGFEYKRSVQPLPRIGPFQERLDALLVENEARPRRDRLRMTRIHDLLLREGFEGSYDAVRRYAAGFLSQGRKDGGDGAAAFIPLMFRPGEAYQFDWSHEDVEIAGKPMRVKVAHMRLPSCSSTSSASSTTLRAQLGHHHYQPGVGELADPPGDTTHWTADAMAQAAVISASAVRRIGKAHGLEPHRCRWFKLSTDPRFVEKPRDVVGLYVEPPARAIIFSKDEKSQIRALDRTQHGLPMKKGRVGTMTHDCKQNGTTALFAALNVLDGTVIGRNMRRHRHQEFICFLNMIERAVPSGKQVHLILDNYAAHKHPKVRARLDRHQRFTFHFTPTRPPAAAHDWQR